LIETVFIAAAAAAAQPIAVLKADFRAETVSPDGQLLSASVTRLPNIPGLCYRWTLTVEPSDRVVRLVERFELPAPAQQWGGVDGNDESPTKLSEQGRVGTTPLFVSLRSGEIGNGWCIAEGDPDGIYRITVSYEGNVLHRFRFTIGEAR
jgi:hypothetical protein